MRKLITDSNGNIPETVQLNFEEFVLLFGFNESRKQKINRLLLFLQIFKTLGCTTIYIVGSFVSNKDFPSDIDICIDTTCLDYNFLLKNYPDFLQIKGIEKIKREHKVHFAAFFDSGSSEILDFFKKDRDGNSRGVVKINLNDIKAYDQK